jgi:hypothetical protein
MIPSFLNFDANFRLRFVPHALVEWSSRLPDKWDAIRADPGRLPLIRLPVLYAPLEALRMGGEPLSALLVRQDGSSLCRARLHVFGLTQAPTP